MKKINALISALLTTATIGFIATTANAAVTKCVIDGKTIYTDKACPTNSTQQIVDTSRTNISQSGLESFSLHFAEHLDWISAKEKGPKFTKFKESYDKMNPTISLHVDTGIFNSADSYFTSFLKHAKNKDPALKIISAASETTLAGKKAYHLKVHATDVIDGKRYPISIEVWAIPRKNPTIYTMYIADQDDAQLYRSEAMTILNSLTIEN